MPFFLKLHYIDFMVVTLTTSILTSLTINSLTGNRARFVGFRAMLQRIEVSDAFNRAMDERIFGPVGMENTTFSHGESMAGNYAKPYHTNLASTLSKVKLSGFRLADET